MRFILKLFSIFLFPLSGLAQAKMENVFLAFYDYRIDFPAREKLNDTIERQSEVIFHDIATIKGKKVTFNYLGLLYKRYNKDTVCSLITKDQSQAKIQRGLNPWEIVEGSFPVGCWSKDANPFLVRVEKGIKIEPLTGYWHFVSASNDAKLHFFREGLISVLREKGPFSTCVMQDGQFYTKSAIGIGSILYMTMVPLSLSYLIQLTKKINESHYLVNLYFGQPSPGQPVMEKGELKRLLLPPSDSLKTIEKALMGKWILKDGLQFNDSTISGTTFKDKDCMISIDSSQLIFDRLWGKDSVRKIDKVQWQLSETGEYVLTGRNKFSLIIKSLKGREAVFLIEDYRWDEETGWLIENLFLELRMTRE